MARILIAEDQDATRQTYAMALRAAGHDVIEAADGADALALLKGGQSIDILLSDVDMPGMTGIELASECLSTKATLPIVLMSAHADHGFKGADKLGASVKARLTKPISNKDLVAAIQAALS
ncbi:MAG: hypothetical protein RL291_1086 [Pseudomonadota bacterium]|jgi:CheY-like chemotaxis protein